jgi:non-heme chloroperoxidase
MPSVPLPPPQYLDVKHGRVAYYDLGNDEGHEQTIVWVHGLPLDARSWALQLDHFHGQARNVLLDLRGYGNSDKLPAQATDITGLYTADLAALVTHLRLEQPMVVGFASAGHVALRFAALHPALLGKLAVLNGSPKFRRSPDWPYGFDDAGIAHFTDAARAGGIKALTDAVLQPDVVFADVEPARADEIGAWFREMSYQAGLDTLLGFFEQISRDDDRELMARITAPTLLMASTIGQEVPTGVSGFLRSTIPNARLAELPGTDHFAFATRPALINNLLDVFLRS